MVYKRPPATGHIDKSDITGIYFCDLITCLSIGLIHAFHACGVYLVCIMCVPKTCVHTKYMTEDKEKKDEGYIELHFEHRAFEN